jgi:hypothetical protein
MAKAAPGSCGSCGFLLPIGGLVGQAFGVCANAFGADGHVVAWGYGCGAHSSVRPIEGTGVPITELVIDELRHHDLDLRSVPDLAVLAVVDDVVLVDDDVEAVDRFADEVVLPDGETVGDESVLDEADLEVVAEYAVLVGDVDAETDDDEDDTDETDEDDDESHDEDDIDDLEPDEVL